MTKAERERMRMFATEDNDADRALVADWIDANLPCPGHLSPCDACPACGHEVNFACRMEDYEPGLGYNRVWFVRECLACGAGWTYDQ